MKAPMTKIQRAIIALQLCDFRKVTAVEARYEPKKSNPRDLTRMKGIWQRWADRILCLPEAQDVPHVAVALERATNRAARIYERTARGR